MAPRKSRDATPPPNPHNTRQQAPLQASGEATGAPPSSLASPAPGAALRALVKLRWWINPLRAAAEAAATASGSGHSPAVGASKKKTSPVVSEKPGSVVETPTKAPTEPTKSSPEVENPASNGGSTPSPPAEALAAPRASSMPDLQSVSDSSVSEEEEVTMTVPLTPLSQAENGPQPAWFAAFPINRQMFAADAPPANVGTSATPSLTSLLNPTSSAPGEPRASLPRSERSTSSAQLHGHGVLSTESVSHFFSHKQEDQRVFVSICREVEVFDEEVRVSLLKYHPVFDPNCDHDPLTSYGAVDGLLPGKTAEEMISFRDIVMRWELPHINLYWETLEEGITSFGIGRLERFPRTTLPKPLHGDPNWQLLRLMEMNVSRNQILMAFATLQHRLRQSSKHIHKHLQSVQLVYGQEGLDLVELAKLLARPDYGPISDTINVQARARIIAEAALEPRTNSISLGPRKSSKLHVRKLLLPSFLSRLPSPHLHLPNLSSGSLMFLRPFPPRARLD
ncbi:hypothetical protein B0H13DRAFT_2369993 [Mycena leptocephala]|nr:hypothetical protein B0H13DRAFT_2369993 [Mycena leptocephala]